MVVGVNKHTKSSKMTHRNASDGRSADVKNVSLSDNEGNSKLSYQQVHDHCDRGGDNGLVHLLTSLDENITKRLALCANNDSPLAVFRPVMKMLELSCHGIPWLVGTLIGILVSHQMWMHQLLLNLFGALVFDLIVVCAVKMIVRRSRPSHNIMDMFATVSVDKLSFPSGHATRAAMVTYFIIVLVPMPQLYRLFLTCWALTVALSRVMLGRHYVFDVICGLVIGVVQFQVFVHFLWMSQELCEDIIRPMQEELHL